jgi:single-stranded DNA-binding protein
MKKHIIVGNLVSAVAIASKDGRDSMSMTVAVNEYKKVDGTQVTSYHSVVASGAPGFAKNVKEYLTKGKGVSLVGTPYINTNEKDNHVYRNSGIRLVRLGDLRFTGQDIVAAPTPGSAVHEPSAAEQAAVLQSQAMLEEEKHGVKPTPDFDNHDDDIPF